MAKVGVVVAVLLLPLTFAGCTDDGGTGSGALQGSSEVAQEAGLQSGFRFRIDGRHESSFEFEFRRNGTLDDAGTRSDRSDMKPQHDLEVLRTAEEVQGTTYDLLLSRPVEDGYRNAQLVAWRQADLAQVSAYAYGDRVSVSSPSVLDGPVRFPLNVGDSWEYRLQFLGESPQNGSIRVQASVTSFGQVEGPAGPVGAFRIEHEMELDSDWFEAAIQESAKRQEFTDVEATGAFSGSLVAYYAPSLHYLVSTESHFEAQYDVEYWDGGSPQEIHVKGTASEATKLTQATFVPAPELSLADLKRAVDLGHRPGQVEPLPAGVVLKVTPPEQHARLENGTIGTVTVTVQTAGLTEDVEVELIKPGGYVIARDSIAPDGGEVSLRVYTGGVHQVVVRTTGLDPDASASAYVPVDLYEWSKPACPTFGLPLTPCSEDSIIVPWDMEEVRFTVMRDPVLSEPGAGTLTLIDPTGKSEEGSLTGNTATLTASKPNSGTWRASYSPTGLPGGIAYILEAISVEEPSQDPQPRTLPGWPAPGATPPLDLSRGFLAP